MKTTHEIATLLAALNEGEVRPPMTVPEYVARFLVPQYVEFDTDAIEIGRIRDCYAKATAALPAGDWRVVSVSIDATVFTLEGFPLPLDANDEYVRLGQWPETYNGPLLMLVQTAHPEFLLLLDNFDDCRVEVWLQNIAA